MPPLLNIIGDANNMDWDTVLVYSCENSCPQSREEYIEAVYDADQEKYFELDKRSNKDIWRNWMNCVAKQQPSYKIMFLKKQLILILFHRINTRYNMYVR